MTVEVGLSGLDPNDEIASLPERTREDGEVIGSNTAWRDDYVVVKGGMQVDLRRFHRL